MFLGVLSQNCKESFFDIAKHLIMADNVLRREEEELLIGYCGEMGLNYDPERVPDDLDALIAKIKSENKVTKKIVYFELLGLALADNDYADEEKAVINKLKEEFEISDSDAELMEDSIIKIYSLYARMRKIVINDI